MTAWENNSNLVPKEQATSKIIELANAQGLKGAFKVFYEGDIVSDPSDLPDQVDMSKIKVSAVLDQAGK